MFTLRGPSFETNSSSMHSICITKNTDIVAPEDFDNMLYNNDTLVVLQNCRLEFDRGPFKILNTVRDKICYVVASLIQGCSTSKSKADKLKEIEEILQEYSNSDSIHIELPMEQQDIFVDKNGTKYVEDDVEYVSNSKYVSCDNRVPVKRTKRTKKMPYYGYVDHQSSRLMEKFLEEKDISLKDFIFNNKYIVIIDGDEYDKFNELIKCGLIDKDNIVETILPW